VETYIVTPYTRITSYNYFTYRFMNNISQITWIYDYESYAYDMLGSN